MGKTWGKPWRRGGFIGRSWCLSIVFNSKTDPKVSRGSNFVALKPFQATSSHRKIPKVSKERQVVNNCSSWHANIFSIHLQEFFPDSIITVHVIRVRTSQISEQLRFGVHHLFWYLNILEYSWYILKLLKAPWFSHDFPRCRCFPPVFFPTDPKERHPLPRGTRRRLGLLRLGGELFLVESTAGHAGATGTSLRLHPAASLLHLDSSCLESRTTPTKFLLMVLVFPGRAYSFCFQHGSSEIFRNNVAKEDMILELLVGRWGWTPFSCEDKKCPSGQSSFAFTVYHLVWIKIA